MEHFTKVYEGFTSSEPLKTDEAVASYTWGLAVSGTCIVLLLAWIF